MNPLSIRLALPAALLLSASSLCAQVPSGSWNVIDVPFDPMWTRAMFEDVAVLDNGDAWAVGSATRIVTGTNLEAVTLAMRYSNDQWENTPTPYVAAYPGGAKDDLHAVAAISSDEVWAAGERHGDAGGLSVGAWLHVIRYDGSTWTEMPVPPPPGGSGINFSGPRIYDIAAIASDDIWFSGMWGEPNALFSVTWRPLAMHWDGSNMTVFPTPAIYTGSNPSHMRQMAVVNSSDIWGICRSNTAGGVMSNPTLLHFDGNAWTQVTAPSLGSSVVLDDIVAIASDDVWVFGHFYYPTAPFAMHWDGSSFSTLTSVPFASTAHATGPGEIYLGTASISLFDGASSTVVETFPNVNGPSVLGMDSKGGTVAWAVGRDWSAPGGDAAPFAARLGAPLIGTAFCYGDGNGTICPCGNQGATGEGCANSTSHGARLSATGSRSVADDDVVLFGANLPAQQMGLYFQGDATLNSGDGVVFGDGLRCADGNIKRLEVRPSNAAGSSSTTLSIVNEGAVTAGDTKIYQLWYRDQPNGPCSTGFNLSNALEITWTP